MYKNEKYFHDILLQNALLRNRTQRFLKHSFGKPWLHMKSLVTKRDKGQREKIELPPRKHQR